MIRYIRKIIPLILIGLSALILPFSCSGSSFKTSIDKRKDTHISIQIFHIFRVPDPALSY